jgi:hypothetical protein
VAVEELMVERLMAEELMVELVAGCSLGVSVHS